MDADQKQVVVLRVAGEGGTITLWGRETVEGRWQYAVDINETAAMDLLSDEDQASFGEHQLSWTDGWEEALSRLGRYSWQRLHPLEVHCDYREKIVSVLQGKRLTEFEAERWSELVGPLDTDKVGILADWLQSSNFTVVFTGAGMSTESGIPDFRSPSGWWQGIDPTTVASTDAVKNHYSLFHDFYTARVRQLDEFGPHAGHMILADWERRGFIHSIATQNVDGFHQLAGNQTVHELHGSIRTGRCSACGASASAQNFVAETPCSSCGGRLRPNVVLFGEELPMQAWDQALADIKAADLVLVIGTSLNVYPASQLPSMCRGKAAVINMEPTSMDGQFDLVIQGKAGEVLSQIHRRICGA